MPSTLQNRAFAATHAYALHIAGKTDEALELMDRMKDEELSHPAVAAYYVVILVESGKLERARAFLPKAQRAALLPEEQLLLKSATRKLVAVEPSARAGAQRRRILRRQSRPDAR